jgi:hypothetical protein
MFQAILFTHAILINMHKDDILIGKKSDFSVFSGETKSLKYLIYTRLIDSRDRVVYLN